MSRILHSPEIHRRFIPFCKSVSSPGRVSHPLPRPGARTLSYRPSFSRTLRLASICRCLHRREGTLHPELERVVVGVGEVCVGLTLVSWPMWEAISARSEVWHLEQVRMEL
jgi:hypothetical protein